MMTMIDSEHLSNPLLSGEAGSMAQGRQIDVEDLYYCVQTGRDSSSRKLILDNVSFSIRPGALCALMGPSGSGKSTLLDLLADRKLIGEWCGEILFNGGRRSRWFQRDSAYVLQDDLHIPTLTVRESLTFSASVRLLEGTTQQQIDARVDYLLELMGLQHIQHSIVGGTHLRGISGGQLRRLSIAVEIVSLPDVIFCDEVTTGLDSTIALEVMNTVKRLCDQNRTVVSTIHQPSAHVFALFDTLVLIAEGKVMYAGSTAQVVPYFSSLGFSFAFGENPAEYIIEISQGVLRSSHHGPQTTDQLASHFASYCHETDASSSSRRRYLRRDSEETITAVQSHRLHATTKATQFRRLLAREGLAILRNQHEIVAHLAKNVVVGFLIGLIFFGQARVTLPIYTAAGIPEAEVNNISALLFFGLMYTMVSNVESIPHLCSRHLVFRREVDAFAYSVSPYWLAHCLSILPVQTAGFLGFCAITFFMCDFPRTAEYFLYFAGVLYLASLSAYFLAMAIAAWTRDEKLSFILFPLCFLFLSTFSGYALPVGDVPAMWSWAPVVSYVRWAFQGTMVNQWQPYDSAEDNDGNPSVLSLYDFDGYDKWQTFWIMALVLGGMLGLAYCAMRPHPSRLQYRRPETLQALRRPARPAKKKTAAGEEVEEEEGVQISNPLGQTDGVQISNPLGQTDEVQTSNPLGQTDGVQISSPLGQAGAALPPSAGVTLSFHDVHYRVPVGPSPGGSPLHVLRGVGATVRPGELTALMGSSGAGKSTLLDVLAARKTAGLCTGRVLWNGRVRTAQAVRRQTAYVMQDSVCVGELTVRETLGYAAQLRLPQAWPARDKHERVQQLLAALALSSVADSRVGDEAVRGISGGQKKRLAIGIEIVHLPDVLFLDEPTSGLDSSMALEVMGVLQGLAARQRTVLCTIHQPSLRTFGLFSHVVLLASGVVIYAGPRASAAAYFQTCVHGFVCAPDANPADFLLEVSSGVAPRTAEGLAPAPPATADGLAQLFAACPLAAAPPPPRPSPDRDQDQDQAQDQAEASAWSAYPTSTPHQVCVLVHRAVLRKLRTPHTTASALARYVVIAVFYASIYAPLPSGLANDCYANRLSLLFFSLLLLLMGHQEDVPALVQDRPLVYREQAACTYSSLAYALSQTVVALALSSVSVAVYASVLYPWVGLRREGQAFAFFVYVLLLTDWISYMLCSLLAYASPSTEVAMACFPVALFFATAFEGFIVYLPEFPPWLGWATNLSYLRFAFQALVRSEFQGNDQLPLQSMYVDLLGFDDLGSAACAGYLWLFLLAHTAASWACVAWLRHDKR